MMPPIVSAHGFALDFDELYARMWDLAIDDGDGTKLYRPTNGEALKWLIADLAGTPAEAGKTLPANNAIREQVHRLLRDTGSAERITQQSFRLLRSPEVRVVLADEGLLGASIAIDDPDDEGQAIDDVTVAAVTDDGHHVVLGSVAWSAWMPLRDATSQATTMPGVYLARSEGLIVYVGMAGGRKGQGVRGRLSVYARGRGAVSGLGEAAFDRALADDVWLAAQIDLLRTSGPSRATKWAAAALVRRPLELCWTAARTTDQARSLEKRVLAELADADLWNRQRPRA